MKTFALSSVDSISYMFGMNSHYAGQCIIELACLAYAQQLSEIPIRMLKLALYSPRLVDIVVPWLLQVVRPKKYFHSILCETCVATFALSCSKTSECSKFVMRGLCM